MVIPAAIRERAGLGPGAEVEITEEDIGSGNRVVSYYHANNH